MLYSIVLSALLLLIPSSVPFTAVPGKRAGVRFDTRIGIFGAKQALAIEKAKVGFWFLVFCCFFFFSRRTAFLIDAF